MQFEKEKEDLAKTMTLKRKRKIEYSTLRLREEEQRATADLVKVQAKEMLGLIAAKQQELSRVEKEALENGKVNNEHPSCGSDMMMVMMMMLMMK